MKSRVKPFASEIPAEIQLSKAPLASVIAQIRFPPILSLRKEDSVADFQEALRDDYPYLQRNEIRNGDSDITETIIWRLSDRKEPAFWRLSLGIDFIALETSNYQSRQDFLSRFCTALESVETCFRPIEAQRVGLRYIDRLQSNDGIGELIQGDILGILRPKEGPLEELRKATIHSTTQVQLQTAEGLIQGRWGNLPPHTTYDPDLLQPVEEPSWVLDLDMFSQEAFPFRSKELVNKTEAFAKRIHSVFRLLITENFLTFYGEKP